MDVVARIKRKIKREEVMLDSKVQTSRKRENVAAYVEEKSEINHTMVSNLKMESNSNQYKIRREKTTNKIDSMNLTYRKKFYKWISKTKTNKINKLNWIKSTFEMHLSGTLNPLRANLQATPS